MKANELMIGDWVMFPHGIDKIVDLPYIEGKGLCASFSASATLFPTPIEQLKSIPLTPEILEKNGWRWVERHSQWELIIDTIHFGWGFYKGCTSASDWDNEGDVEITSLRCEFVHQLQHALRLCGIEKEIVI